MRWFLLRLWDSLYFYLPPPGIHYKEISCRASLPRLSDLVSLPPFTTQRTVLTWDFAPPPSHSQNLVGGSEASWGLWWCCKWWLLLCPPSWPVLWPSQMSQAVMLALGAGLTEAAVHPWQTRAERWDVPGQQLQGSPAPCWTLGAQGRLRWVHSTPRQPQLCSHPALEMSLQQNSAVSKMTGTGSSFLLFSFLCLHTMELHSLRAEACCCLTHPLNPLGAAVGGLWRCKSTFFSSPFEERWGLHPTAHWLFVIQGTARLLPWCCGIWELHLARQTSQESCASFVRCELQVTRFASASKGQGDSGSQWRNHDEDQAEVAATTQKRAALEEETAGGWWVSQGGRGCRAERERS